LKLATGVIPARYRSERFPGKALAPILGKPMIQRVYEAARTAKYLEQVILATDDETIFQEARNFGAEVLMTSPHHVSGTDRVAEVAERTKNQIIINIQGDEPLIRGEAIDQLVEALQDKDIPMATLAVRESDLSLLDDSGVVKVVPDNNGIRIFLAPCRGLRLPEGFPPKVLCNASIQAGENRKT
jgi:3-deoxy-manno-octulosonate cytidylyltransferase (CMP-KDO synthetase)